MVVEITEEKYPSIMKKLKGTIMDSSLLLTTLIWTGSGFLINEMAKSRGRNQTQWVLLSLLLSPVLGIIALLLVGKKKEENNEG